MTFKITRQEEELVKLTEDTEIAVDDLLSEAAKYQNPVRIWKGPASGFFSQEIVNQMIIRGHRHRYKIDTLFVSEAARQEMTGWTDSEIEGFDTSQSSTLSIKIEVLPDSVNRNVVIGVDSSKGLEGLIVGHI